MPDQDELAGAIASEAGIALQAAEIRGDEVELTPALFMKLWPLLTTPIPQAFIQTVGKVQGKPYVSTGIRSVQVQIDRMNNVLTPLWWWDEVAYERDGKLCTVTITIGNRSVSTQRGPFEEVFAYGRSSGGVDRGSSTGNIFKGSYTNAAKLAFARLGVGHEVYLGATDLDPDVSQEIASEGETARPETITRAIAKKLVDRAWAAGAGDRLQLAGSHAAGGRDIGECDTKPKAVEALQGLTFAEAEKLDTWIGKKEEESK